jgi:hypothetical protein
MEPRAVGLSCLNRLGWRTKHGQVRGWIGGHPVDFMIARSSGEEWTLNGTAMPGLENVADLDFAFTPATNLLQLRRIALVENQAADVPVHGSTHSSAR